MSSLKTTYIKTLLASAALICATPLAAQGVENAPVPEHPTAAQAESFVAAAEKQLLDFGTLQQQANWVNETYITEDTDALAAYINGKGTEMGVKLAKAAAKYSQAPNLAPATQRKLDLLRDGLVLAAPDTPGAADALSQISTRMSSAYGKGRGSLNGKPLNHNNLEAEMGNLAHSPAELQEMWTSWHQVGAGMRGDYIKMIDIANEGARGLGYKDTGDMWRAGYDMPAADFATMTDKLWGEVKPLYNALHCYTRAKLHEKYGDAVQPNSGAIRADLLGNMWAQDWSKIYPLVAPKTAAPIGYDVGDLLKAKNVDEQGMVHRAENFYTSLGFKPLPETFWKRSLFTDPKNRDVECHASAWDIDNVQDLRVKMCIKIDGTDFTTIHHELGHNFYQRAYNTQPLLFRNGANDGFHEAIGDFIALSVTPDYLVQTGLLEKDKVPPAEADIGLLLRQALEKVPGLPWTLLVDKYRWDVFSGKIPTSALNKGWNDVRLHYMGVKPPVARDETQFDAGAKYHIAASVPYTRYFLARLYQFQFYQAACQQIGWKGPLHRCTFYGHKELGDNFNTMLAMGQSQPWPEALAAFTGSKEMSGKPIVAYFAPLMAWLEKQNAGKKCGWE